MVKGFLQKIINSVLLVIKDPRVWLRFLLAFGDKFGIKWGLRERIVWLSAVLAGEEI
ncbi:hypothetical protein [Leptospira noumeaensis]|uniref:hypothetical protein n=1 Tax=Leptospira noumeaensis TaxID=2484964 RepID=UPI00142E06B3|nr:hypothetical protein [Leptospira noumeaensis]